MSGVGFSNITGCPNEFSVEERLLNTVTFASASIVLFTTMFDTIVSGLVLVPFLISILVTIIFFFVYYRSRHLALRKWNVEIVIVTAVFTLNYFWFFLDGPSGIIPLAMVFASAFFVSIGRGNSVYYIIGFVCLDVLFLHFISFQYPDLIVALSSEFAMRMELALFNFLALLLTALLIVFFKKNFEEEKKIIEVKNTDLAASEEELRQSSEELKSINDHLQEARDRAELSTKAKANFLSTMSHEIRTPLNAIIASSHALQVKNKIDPEDKEKVGIINFASEQLLHLINDILDFSKIEAGELIIQKSDFNIKDFLGQLISSFKEKAEKNNVKLKLDCDSNIKSDVHFDKVRLTQILTNLIDNAIKFSAGKSVKVQVILESSDEQGQNISFKVVDTGIGIKEHDQETIFNSFKQAEESSNRQYGGTGLGLSITKRLLELLESKIHLNSEYGQGTTFYFSLSMALSKVPVQKSSDVVTSVTSSLVNKKVLIVDDNKLNLKVAEMILEVWEMDVTSVISAKEAISALENGFPDMILMDLQMPELDGYEATAMIRDKYPEMQNIPIIALTASATRDVRDRALKAGLDNFVTKPFIPEKLKDVLLSHLED